MPEVPPPFERAWPAGLANEDVPTHSGLNKVDENAKDAGDYARHLGLDVIPQETQALRDLMDHRLPIGARYGIHASEPVAPVTFVLSTGHFEDTGFSLENSNTAIKTPGGLYQLNYGVTARSSSASALATISAALRLDGTNVLLAIEGRRTTEPDDWARIDASTVLYIANPDHLLTVNITANEGGTPTLFPAAPVHHISLTRLRPLPPAE